MRRLLAVCGLLAGAATAGAQPAAAPAPARDGRWAVIVSGASGGADYAAQLAGWRQAISAALVSQAIPERERLARYPFLPAAVAE